VAQGEEHPKATMTIGFIVRTAARRWTEANMRLVDADALIDTMAIIAKKFAKTDAQKALMGRVMYHLERKPECIVRCKDCKRSGMYEFGCGDEEHLACLDIEEDGFVLMATAVNDDDHCSRGERKEE
jgi:hypothetical protein